MNLRPPTTAGRARRWAGPAALLLLTLPGCVQVSPPPVSPGETAASLAPSKSSAEVRAARRAYDGAPPVAPHEDFGMDCTSCHNEDGVEIEDLGYAPTPPHPGEEGQGAMGRCRQCHAFAQTEERFVASTFTGLRQDLRHGQRLHPLAPPTIPHRVFMREHCAACHTGAAAREAIRTSHPERVRCVQCHAEVKTRTDFIPPGA